MFTMYVFAAMLFLGIAAFIIGVISLVTYRDDGGTFGAFFVAFIFIYLAGFVYPKANDTFFVVTDISQDKKGYVIYTDHCVKFYQKQCSYKIGDTLWIKK